ncbi:MAG TPA: MFS transporter, partial [Acidimicrobiales bacterium]|nr:MFS transporter [Acidimicrobiales bacterium]
PAARRPDTVGSVLSMLGLGLVLWAIIEAPVRGWSSPVAVGPGIAGLTLVGLFVAWERASSHPMLDLEFFRRRSFSVAVCTVGLAAFALMGTLFLQTQFLQFNLGYSPLAAGVRMLPIAAALAVVAPASAALSRRAGTKLTAAAGLLLAAVALWQLSHASVASGYADVVGWMTLVGAGAALVLPSVSASVMSSVPRGDTGVGAATNGTFMQFGAALGVAILGSLLSTRYQDQMVTALAPYHVPGAIERVVLGSIGGALAVARRVGGPVGAFLVHAARSAFIEGNAVALGVAAAVALAGCALALALLPSRPPADVSGAPAPSSSRQVTTTASSSRSTMAEAVSSGPRAVVSSHRPTRRVRSRISSSIQPNTSAKGLFISLQRLWTTSKSGRSITNPN